MNVSDDVLKSLAKRFMPQEEMLAIQKKKGKLFVGIPIETSMQENRIALVPEAVALLVNNGHEVVVERGAGKGSGFEDRDYSEAGAQITENTEEVYKANIILKVEPPSLKEIEMMQEHQILFSALQLSVQPKYYLQKLSAKKITAIAFNYITNKDGTFPVIRTMSEIAGTTAILIAAENLSNIHGGQGMMFGGIAGVPPTKVVIVGAGTVGEYAARSALGLGATVEVYDNKTYKLRRLQNIIGQRIYTSVINPKELAASIKQADVLIGAIRAEKGRSAVIVPESMVKEMKAGAVIVDVSADQGGCIETSEVTTHAHPTFKKYGVIHYCVPNIASRVSKSASQALSNFFAPLLIKIADEGGIENTLQKGYGVRQGVYLYRGILTNKYLGELFNLPYKDIDLLIASM